MASSIPYSIRGFFLAVTLGILVGGSGCVFDKSGVPFQGVYDDAAVVPDAGDSQAAVCGNGIIDQAEACDGIAFGGQTCVTFGFDNGDLTCTTGCEINFLGCSTCGDDEQQGAEHCDGDDLEGGTCEGLGFDGGSLSCSETCHFDTDLCTGSGCGDGVIDAGELCDSGNLEGQTCATLGFTAGVLSCGADCQFNTSGCDTCGDGLRTGLEDCDGADLDGFTCGSLWHDGGTLTCTSGCVFDESACTDCGNSVLEAGEDCEGANLNNADCLSEGFDGGNLTCDPACAFDTTACTTCGDGQVDPGEQCDEGVNNSDGNPDACREDCTNYTCGDGVCDTNEHGGACLQDCKVVVFADGFDGAWKNGWSTGDNYPILDLVDTWAPNTLAAHSGTKSLWCVGEGFHGVSDDTYDNNMGAWAVHTVDLSTATGTVHFDLWVWVHVTDGDDYFSVSYNHLGGGSDWVTLETIGEDTGGWVSKSYDITVGVGNPNFEIELWFYADGSNSGALGALVDDIEVWYTP